MLGAIVGDIVGSVYEFNSHKSKDFPLWGVGCTFTDDTVMTVAAANVCRRLYGTGADEPAWRESFGREMHRLGNAWPDRGYGGRFQLWLDCEDPRPYNSCGNGSAMRVSPVSLAAGTLEECLLLARLSAEPSHDHPEGIRGAQATAAAGWLAGRGYPKEEIRRYIHSNFYALDFTLDEIRPSYSFNATCQASVPQAIEAFLESTDFEDAIRSAVSIGGDSDTIAAIAGGIAGAFYGVPEPLAEKALGYLPPELQRDVLGFQMWRKNSK